MVFDRSGFEKRHRSPLFLHESMATNDVPRRSLEPEEFWQEYVNRRKPVVLTNALKGSAALNWTKDYLKKICDVKQRISPLVTTRPSTDDSKQLPTKAKVSMPLGTFFEKIFSTEITTEYLKLGLTDIENFQSLSKDLDIGAYIPSSDKMWQSVWFGSEGHLTESHYDMQDNLLCQAVGKKEVTLFSVNDTRENMYLRSLSDPLSNFSRVNIANPNYNSFPRFKKAQAYQCTLSPGDALFIPAFWTHHVVYLETSLSVGSSWLPTKRQAWNFLHLRYVPGGVLRNPRYLPIVFSILLAPKRVRKPLLAKLFDRL